MFSRSQLLLVLLGLFAHAQAHAYYSTMDTGDLLERDNYKLGIETQFITDSPSGMNVVGRFDSFFSSDSNVRAIMGFGSTDFQLGGYYKWVPIPDIDNQPAIGLLAGVLYATDQGINELSLRFHPLISKKYGLEMGGDITPYASIPFGIRSVDGTTDVPVQFEMGAQLKTAKFEKVLFVGEVGFDISKAFTYISIGATLQFDEYNGIEFK